MNQNENQTHLKNTSLFTRFKKRCQHRLNALPPLKRFVFFASGVAATVAGGIATWQVGNLAPAQAYPTAIGLVGLLLMFLASWLWPIIRPERLNGKKIGSPKIFIYLAVTVWLSLFTAVNCNEAHAAQINNHAALASAHAIAVSSPATTSNSKIVDCLWEWIFVFVIVGIFLIMIAYLLCGVLHWCGNAGNPPPAAPGNGDGDNIATKITNSKPNISGISTNLPVNIFYVQSGVVVSNTAGLQSLPVPSLISFNGVSVPNGSSLPYTPGLTQPSTIGLWNETNVFADSLLDPGHAYITVLNYTLLTTTNLASTNGWHENYTVEGWINDNPSTPLICMEYYTNGFCFTTNWLQVSMDYLHNGTITVYGALPQFQTPFTTTTATANAVPKGGPIGPGGSGTGGTNGITTTATGQYFMLTCSTNEIKTSWP
jgi:hypothetical protein